MTQIKHVTGYLAFWDELRRRHPDLLIDSCASGGRRNDLETMRRSVPLLRSDYQFEPVGQQGHTYGLAFWLPYYGAGVGPQYLAGSGVGSPQYVMRSSVAPCYASSVNVTTASANDWESLRTANEDVSLLADDLFGDYYPLTPYTLDKGTWCAFQFDRPETGSGAVLAFRRSVAAPARMALSLRALTAASTYVVNDLDGADVSVSGRLLRSRGLDVHLPTAPAAALFSYRREN